MDYKYKAFISYRHREPDKTVAIHTQKLLESFRMRGIAPWKVFRDEAELPTSFDLSDDIDQALRDSEYLIVICTPELKASHWCMQEIDVFKTLHGGSTDHILPILAEGLPEDALPEQLCTTMKTVRSPESGELVSVEMEIEPLAANVVSSTQSETIRKLKTEYLRVAAPMAGVGFDSLYNRKRRQQLRKIVAAAAVVMIGAVSFGLYNMSVSRQLEEKNAEISRQLEQIRQDEAEISRQLEKIEMDEAVLLNTQSETYYESGQTRDAITAVLGAFEINGEGEPLNADSVRILADEIGAYEADVAVPYRRLVLDNSVGDFWFLADGQRLLTVDKNKNYMLWDTQSGDVIGEWSGSRSLEAKINDQHEMANPIRLVDKDPSQYYGIKDNVGALTLEGYRSMEPSQDIYAAEDDIFYLYSYGEIITVDALTGEESTVSGRDIFSARGIEVYSADVHLNGEYFEITSTDYTEHVTTMLLYDGRDVVQEIRLGSWSESGAFRTITDHWVIDRKSTVNGWNRSGDTTEATSFELSHMDEMNSLREESIKQLGDKLVSTTWGFGETERSMDFNTVTVEVRDERTGRVLWLYEEELFSSEILDTGILPGREETEGRDVLFLVCGDRIILFDAETGEVFLRNMFADNILDYYYSQNGRFLVTLADGKIVFSLAFEEMVTLLMFKTGTDVAEMKYCAGSCAIARKNSKLIDLYEYQDNGDSEQILDIQRLIGEKEGNLYTAKLTDDGEYALCYVSSKEMESRYNLFSYCIATQETKLLFAGDIFNWYILDGCVMVEADRTDYRHTQGVFIDYRTGEIVKEAEYKECAYFQKPRQLAWISVDEDANTIPILHVFDGHDEKRIDLKIDDRLGFVSLNEAYGSNDGRNMTLSCKFYDEDGSAYYTVYCDLEACTATRLGKMSEESEQSYYGTVFDENGKRALKICANQKAYATEDNVPKSVLELYDVETWGKITTITSTDKLYRNAVLKEDQMWLMGSDYTVDVMDYQGNLVASIVLDYKGARSEITSAKNMLMYDLADEKTLILYGNDKNGFDGWVVDRGLNVVLFGIGNNDVWWDFRGYDELSGRVYGIDCSQRLISYPIYSAQDLYVKAKTMLNIP